MTMADRFTSIIDVFDDANVGPSLDQVATRAELPRSAHDVALGLAALAAVAPEAAWLDLAAELHRVRRTGGLVRAGDYAAGLTSVAATGGARSTVGIVLSDNVSGERYVSLAIDAAAGIRRNLG